MQPKFDIVVAITPSLGIGKDGSMPWPCIPKDMKFFKELTCKTNDPNKKNVCIMGRKTYFSIPESRRPLVNRVNIVISRNENLQKELPDGVFTFTSLKSALDWIPTDIESVFVIGGSEIYNEALKMPNCRFVYCTQLFKDYECDVFFPSFKNDFILKNSEEPVEEKGIKFQFLCFEKK